MSLRNGHTKRTKSFAEDVRVLNKFTSLVVMMFSDDATVM